MLYDPRSSDVDRQIIDEWALLQLAMRYAEAVDRRRPEALAALFTEDGVIARGGFVWRGRAQLLGIPARLDGLYASTLHSVRNQVVTIDGDTAEGETYCVAYHLGKPKDGAQIRADWGIRYHDSFARQDGHWLFARRELIVDWVETTALPLPRHRDEGHFSNCRAIMARSIKKRRSDE
jgi:uncharacterized protein (TIGR02246 family)